MTTPGTAAKRRAAFDAVIAVLVAPFDDQNEIDERSFGSLMDRLVGAGVSAVTVNGNTGEFYSLDAGERRRLIDLAAAWCGRAEMVAGVGLDIATATAEASYAEAHGLPYVMVHQPVHPHWSAGGWVDYHRAVSDAAPSVGQILYVKDPRIDAVTMGAVLDACPTIVAVKYAVADLLNFAALARTFADRCAWICGLAEAWAPAFAVAGASGFTSGLAVVDPTRSLALLGALRAGDDRSVRRTWASVVEFETMRATGASQNNVSTVKEALAQLGLCNRSVRSPSTTLPESERMVVRRILGEWGLEPRT